MNEQLQLFRLGLTLGRNHPELYEQLATMSLGEIGEIINELENVNIYKGMPMDELSTIITHMKLNHYERIIKNKKEF